MWRMTLRGLLLGAMLGSIYGGLMGLMGALAYLPGVLEAAAGNALDLALIGGFLGPIWACSRAPGAG